MARRRVIAWVILAIFIAGVVGAAIAPFFLDDSASNGQLRPSDTVAVAANPMLPDVTLSDLDGAPVQLDSLAGRPLVLNFWYSSCPPCAEEMPAFAAVAAEMGEAIRFVGINPTDTAERAREFASDKGVLYEQLLDRTGRSVDALGVTKFPSTVFVDADGEVLGIVGHELTAAQLHSLLAELFGDMIDGQFALNFLRGVLATVNPCGFVLLPTYLMFFLGTEGARPGTQRASLQRALLVSAAVSAGFFTVFLVIGLAVQSGMTWFTEQFDLFGLVVGVGLIVLGIAMLFGFKPKLFVPNVPAGGKREGTVVSMYLYGVSYAIASLGCTIGLFLPALASAERNGYVSAVLATVLYGLGMAFTLTALTVTLALARTGLLGVMRGVMVHLDVVAGALMVLTGAYLVWYWGSEVREPGSDKGAAVNRVEDWQTKVANWLNDLGVWPLVFVFGGVTLAAVVYVVARRQRAAQ